MATCYNKSAPEYVELSNNFDGKTLEVDAIISSWQKLNSTDEFPTVSEANDLIKTTKTAFSLKQKNFGDSLLANLSRSNYINKKSNGSYYVTATKSVPFNLESRIPSNTVLNNNIRKIQKFLQINGLAQNLITIDPITKKVELNVNLFTQSDIIEQSRLRTSPRSKNLLAHLATLFPDVSIKIATVAQAENYYNSLPAEARRGVPFKDVKSFFYNGDAILIKGRTSNETAIEEILHPFINAVYEQNTELFENLLIESKKNFPQLWQQIQNSYTEVRGFSTLDKNLELVTQSLSRHFNEEYEKNPTSSFKTRIREFLEWFSNIVNNLHEYVTGKPLKIKASNLNSKAKLTDIAKLINTTDIVFDTTLKSTATPKVQFSLSPRMQDVVGRALAEGNDVQKALIYKLIHGASMTDKEVDMLSAGLEETGPVVVLNQKDHTYMDINTGDTYNSTTKRFKGEMSDKQKKENALNIEIGNDFDSILESIILAKTKEESLKDIKILNNEEAQEAYKNMFDYVQMMKAGGSVALTQVIVYDKETKTAGAIDILLIKPNGELQIIDLKTSKHPVLNNESNYAHEYKLDSDSELLGIDGVTTISKRQQHNLQVNMYRRMLENMGYNVSMDEMSASTFHIHVDIAGKGLEQKFLGTFRFDTWLPHLMSQNEDKIDVLIPRSVNVLNKMNIDEALENTENNPLKGTDQLPIEDQLTNIDFETGDPGIDMILGALDTYKKALIDREKAIKTVRSQIYMNKSEAATIENIAQSIAAISIDTTLSRKAVSRLYTEFLQQGLKDVREFTEYVQDPNNFGKSEYISYVMNYDRFMETYRGLYELDDTTQLNATQRSLVLNFQIELNKMVGTKGTEGLINESIDNYVKEVVRTRSKRNFTEEQLDELLKHATDITGVEYQTGDLATSGDTLLAIMDKIYKSKKQELLDKLQSRDAEIRTIASKLQKLSPGTDPQKLYKFMIEFDEDGVPTGRYIKKLGSQYYNEMMKRRDLLLDETGNWKSYLPITDLTTADPSDVKYNKDLYKAKKQYADFWKAETVSASGKPVGGEFHRYTDKFKSIRDKFEYFVPNGDTGYWIKKGSVTDKDYKVYRAKYYEEVDYTKAVLKDGMPTGQIIEGKTFEVPKNEFRIANDTTSKGVSMLSDKYVKLQNPQTALEKAQKEFYDMFYRLYETELLEKIPQAQRTAMLGKIPVQKGKLYDNLKTKPSIITKMFADSTRSVKNLFTETATSKNVLTDEQGNMIDSMPIFYTGKLRSDEELANIEAEIEALDQKRKDNKISISKYNHDKKFLKGRRLKIQNAPTASELNLDLGTALLKFNAMAEHYETMNQVEDTLKAMLDVITRRTYDETVDTKLYKSGREKIKNVGVGKYRVGKAGADSNVLRRAKKWMNMVYYDNENVTRGTMEKLADGLIQFSSLSYVAFNPFGNFNNYMLGKINNNIEAVGGRFFSGKAYARAVYEFNKRALPDLIKRTAYNGEELADLATFNTMRLSNKKIYDPYKAGSKYEALVDLFRMMDDKADIRESGNQGDKAFKSWFAKATEIGYVMQDAAEYNVQTKIGMAILMDTRIRKSSEGKGGESISLYDAFRFNSDTKEAELIEGYDTIIEKGGKERAYTNEYRYEIRNDIREVNKQVHGNYAYEDRMVMQSHYIGKLAAQFHKWVAPAIKARFRREYFDENLGWMEGRYKSMIKLSAHTIKEVAKGNLNVKKWTQTFKENYDKESTKEEAEARADNIIKNTYRSLGELGIMLMTLGATYLLEAMLKDDDDDSEFETKLENFLIYQADRTYKEMILFMPVFPDSWTQLHQMFKSPIASTRTLGELGEALSLSVRTPFGYMSMSNKEFYGDSEYVYQRKPRKGQLKVNKAWRDALPIIYSMQKWNNFLQSRDFFIK